MSPADGATDVPTTVTLVGGVSGQAPPYSYQYTVYVPGVAQAIVTSPWVPGSWTVPPGLLAADSVYVWSVSVGSGPDPYIGTLFNDASVFSTGPTLHGYAGTSVRLDGPESQSILTTSTPTLSEHLIYPAGTYAYSFDVSVCQDVNCFSTAPVVSSGWLASPSWTVPASALSWDRVYTWTANAIAVGAWFALTWFPQHRTFAVMVPESAATRAGVGGDASTVDGVGLYDRHFEHSDADLSVPSTGTPLSITRGYSTVSTVDGPFGPGWWSALSVALSGTDAGMDVTMADGHVFSFGRNPDGSYAPAPGATGTSLAGCGSPCVARFTDVDSVVYQFDVDGLERITAADGLTTALHRDGAGRVTSLVDDASGRSLAVTWSGSHVSTVTAIGTGGQVGTSWTYTYSGATLASACATGGGCDLYTYAGGSAPRLATVSRSGQSPTTVVHYQTSGQVSDVTTGRLTTTFAAVPTAAGQRVTATTAAGATTEYDLDQAGRTVREVSRGGTQRWQYDLNGELTLYQAAAGSLLQLTYDARRLSCRTLWREDGLRVSQDYAYVQSGNGLGKLWMVSDANSFALWGSFFGYSQSSGNRELAYDTAGRVVSVGVGHPGSSRSTEQYRYTAGSEPAVGGGVVPAGLLASVTDAAGGVTSFGYDSAGDVVTQTSPGGVVTGFTYDAFGRVIRESVSGGGVSHWVDVAYDALGRVSADRFFPVAVDAVTGARHQERDSWVYDSAGDLVSATVADAVSGEQRTTRYGYDAWGEPTSTTGPDGSVQQSAAYDGFGRVATSTDGDGDVTRYGWTPWGDLASATAVGVSTVSKAAAHDVVTGRWTYDSSGRVATSTDRAGLVRAYTYAFDDQVASVTDRAVPQPDGTTRDMVERSAVYDADGNQVYLALDDGSTVTSTVYDDHDRPTQVNLSVPAVGKVPGSTRSVVDTYDVRGLVTSESVGSAAAPQKVTASTYDADGDLVSQTVSDLSSSGSARTYRVVRDGIGQVVGVIDPRAGPSAASVSAWTTTLLRDARGRVVSTTTPTAGSTAPSTTSTGYDGFGEATSVQGPGGQVSTTAYDALGRVVATTTAHAPGATVPSAMTVWTPGGRTASTTDASGVTTAYGYDRLGDQTSVTRPALSGSGTRVATTGWDDAGPAVRSTDATGVTSTSVYDVLDRLRQTSVPATGPDGKATTLTTRYGYDVAGDVNSVTDPDGGVSTRSYDAAGELVAQTDADGVGQTYYRDFVGRVVKVVGTDG